MWVLNRNTVVFTKSVLFIKVASQTDHLPAQVLRYTEDEIRLLLEHHKNELAVAYFDSSTVLQTGFIHQRFPEKEIIISSVSSPEEEMWPSENRFLFFTDEEKKEIQYNPESPIINLALSKKILEKNPKFPEI